MSRLNIESWVNELEKEVIRDRKVFLHLSEAYPLSREAVRAIARSIYSVDDYLENGSDGEGLLLISDLESLTQVTGSEFGRLREQVYADLDKGAHIIFLSRVPRISFPNVPGSSLIHETKLYLPPDHGVAGFGAESMARGTPLQMVLIRTLFELGGVTCASLDAALFDELNQPVFGLLDNEELEPLLSSGLAIRNQSGFKWAAQIEPNEIREALSRVIAEIRTPQPELAHVSVKAWAIERQIKQALRSRAHSLWGTLWKTELLGNAWCRESALRRAQGGTCPEAISILDLRDPLEWLTIEEVLRVREEAHVGNLGLADALWKKFEHEFLPVKDRLERSQLLRKKDRDLTLRWADRLSRCLSTSGSIDADSAIQNSPEPQVSILQTLRDDLAQNSMFKGDTKNDFMSLVIASLRFLINVFDNGPSFTKSFKERSDAPLEKDLQNAFRTFLDASGMAGLVANEVGTIAAGRADVVLHFNDGRRFVTEVKREFGNPDRQHLDKKYLEQAVAYQGTNAPFGQLLVLDLSSDTPAHEERIANSMWVSHSYDELGNVIASTLVSVVRGNRKVPSAR